jgi:hypothetical protein
VTGLKTWCLLDDERLFRPFQALREPYPCSR